MEIENKNKNVHIKFLHDKLEKEKYINDEKDMQILSLKEANKELLKLIPKEALRKLKDSKFVKNSANVSFSLKCKKSMSSKKGKKKTSKYSASAMSSPRSNTSKRITPFAKSAYEERSPSVMTTPHKLRNDESQEMPYSYDIKPMEQPKMMSNTEDLRDRMKTNIMTNVSQNESFEKMSEYLKPTSSEEERLI